MKKQTTKRSAKTTKKTVTRARSPRKTAQRVDYYPNRMMIAVSALAGTSIVLLSVMAALV